MERKTAKALESTAEVALRLHFENFKLKELNKELSDALRRTRNLLIDVCPMSLAGNKDIVYLFETVDDVLKKSDQ